jgi:hypothetical protein
MRACPSRSVKDAPSRARRAAAGLRPVLERPGGADWPPWVLSTGPPALRGKARKVEKILTVGPQYVPLLFVSSPQDSNALHDQRLGRLADLAMALAEDSARLATEAETLDERDRHIAAFDRMARSARLTISLQRRVRRDIRTDQAEAVETRKKQLRAALIPAVQAGARHIGERLEREKELDEALAEDALYDAFLQLPLETALANLREHLGLPPEDAVPPPQGEGSRVAVEGVEARRARRAPSATLQPARMSTTKTTKGPLPFARAGPS